MEPSGSFEPAELKLTVRGAMPEVGVADAAATGGALGVPVGRTSNVMLCGGAVKFTVDPEKLTFARCEMTLAEVNWYTSAVPLVAKLLTAMATGVVPDRYLLITMMVNAPSDVRCAANTATLSGLGPPAETLVSPNMDWFP